MLRQWLSYSLQPYGRIQMDGCIQMAHDQAWVIKMEEDLMIIQQPGMIGFPFSSNQSEKS